MQGLRAAGGGSLAAIERDPLALEGAAFRRKLGDVELGLVPEHRDYDATEPMGYGDHRQLVAPPRAQRPHRGA